MGCRAKYSEHGLGVEQEEVSTGNTLDELGFVVLGIAAFGWLPHQ